MTDEHPPQETPAAAWAVRVAADLEAVDVHRPVLEEAGLLGVVEDVEGAVLYFPEPVADLPWEGRWDPVPERDWHAAWREGVTPITVGQLTIAPPWLGAPDATTLVLEPGQAFGTGHHETTAGCLAALQELELAGRSVLDVGCGSGVLALAAARLGADPVVACDVDPLATAATREAATTNGVTLTVHEGDVAAVPPPTGGFAVVVANLDTATLSAQAPALVDALAEGGTLVASGVSLERVDEATAALDAAGLPVLVRRGAQWAVLIGRRPVAAPAPHQRSTHRRSRRPRPSG